MAKKIDKIVADHKKEPISIDDAYEVNHHTTLFAIVAIVGIVAVMSTLTLYTQHNIGPGMAYQVAVEREPVAPQPLSKVMYCQRNLGPGVSDPNGQYFDCADSEQDCQNQIDNPPAGYACEWVKQVMVA